MYHITMKGLRLHLDRRAKINDFNSLNIAPAKAGVF